MCLLMFSSRIITPIMPSHMYFALVT